MAVDVETVKVEDLGEGLAMPEQRGFRHPAPRTHHANQIERQLESEMNRIAQFHTRRWRYVKKQSSWRLKYGGDRGGEG